MLFLFSRHQRIKSYVVFLAELEALKERFLKHSMHKVKAAAEKKVHLQIVRKERTADGKEELKTDIVPVTVDAENVEEKTHTKPGSLNKWHIIFDMPKTL